MRAKRKKHLTSWDIGVIIISLILTFIILYPFLNVIAVSLSKETAYYKNPLMIMPRSIELTAYGYVLQQKLIKSGFTNTIFITFVGTLFSMFVTVTLAYPLSRKDFKGRKIISKYLLFTMIFNGGLIPNFLLVKGLGLFDTIWALVLPSSLSAYNCILIKNYFQSISPSLIESATIDGASDLKIFGKIILPLSKPILATITLFYSVGRWNAFFQAIVYVKDRKLWTLQLVLREIVASVNSLEGDMVSYVSPRNIKYSVIVVSMLPILCVYPFVQKYFVSGTMVGAVKE